MQPRSFQLNENANIIYGLNKLCRNEIKRQQQPPSFTSQILGLDIDLHKQVLPHATTKIGSCFAFSFLAYLLNVQNQKLKKSVRFQFLKKNEQSKNSCKQIIKEKEKCYSNNTEALIIVFHFQITMNMTKLQIRSYDLPVRKAL